MNKRARRLLYLLNPQVVPHVSEGTSYGKAQICNISTTYLVLSLFLFHWVVKISLCHCCSESSADLLE